MSRIVRKTTKYCSLVCIIINISYKLTVDYIQWTISEGWIKGFSLSRAYGIYPSHVQASRNRLYCIAFFFYAFSVLLAVAFLICFHSTSKGTCMLTRAFALVLFTISSNARSSSFLLLYAFHSFFVHVAWSHHFTVLLAFALPRFSLGSCCSLTSSSLLVNSSASFSPSFIFTVTPVRSLLILNFSH